MTTTTPGILRASVLEQSTHWVDVAGVERRLEDLDRRHLANLEPFLRKHGEALRWRWFVVVGARHYATVPEVIGEVDGKPVYSDRSVSLWSDNGGNLDAAFYEWSDFELDRPLDDWLAARPLVVRIRQLLKDHHAV